MGRKKIWNDESEILWTGVFHPFEFFEKFYLCKMQTNNKQMAIAKLVRLRFAQMVRLRICTKLPFAHFCKWLV